MVARKKTPPAPPQDPEQLEFSYLTDEGALWGGFINIRLSDEQKAAYHEWANHNDGDVPGLFVDLLGYGMKIGFSYDGENQCFVCTLTGRLCQSLPDRFVMTTRAGTYFDVLCLAVWKHYFLARGDYDNFQPRGGNFPVWG